MEHFKIEKNPRKNWAQPSPVLDRQNLRASITSDTLRNSVRMEKPV
jgi:hypothetical protein